MKLRDHKLNIHVYRGSIDTYHQSFNHVDLVYGIEIIEHLFPETLENTPYNIFHKIRPKVIALSTPNADINGLFEMTTQFRHFDHKFEWSQEQFRDWAYNLCDRFTDYIVCIYGIGRGPTGKEELGSCSQMALFVRRDFWRLTETPGTVPDTALECEMDSLNLKEEMHNSSSEHSYKLIYSFEIPAVIDRRSREQRILDEGKHQLGFMRQEQDKFYTYEKSVLEIPLQLLYDYIVVEKDFDVDELKKVLQNNAYVINDNGNIEIDPFDEDRSDEEQMDMEPFDSTIEPVKCDLDNDPNEHTSAWDTGDSTTLHESLENWD